MDPKTLIRTRMKSKSMREVATELGVSPSTLSLVLADRRSPGPKLLEALGLTKTVERKVTYRRAKTL